LAGIVLALVVACNGDDPVEPGQPPAITLFSVVPDDILPGDSILVTYKVLRADSLLLYPPAVKLTPTDSGQTYARPAYPTVYSLVAYNSYGVDSAGAAVVMTAVTAEVVSFQASQPTIARGDSTELTWQTQNTDSLVIDNGVGKVADPGAGSVTVAPNVPTVYTAVAYNVVPDTGQASLNVLIPWSVAAVNGLHYRGEMGSALLSPAMELAVADEIGQPIPTRRIYLTALEGDGTLSADSVIANAAGIASAAYEFSGQLGHALVEASHPEADSATTIELKVRADALIPGPAGQGQYILFDDTYADVRSLNGDPESIDEDPYDWYAYAVYEATLGVVVRIVDENQNTTADPGEPVQRVIVNTVYQTTTAEGIGIGSRYPDLVTAYGPPDSSGASTLYPQDTILFYYDLGLTIWCNRSDTVINEIWLSEPSAARLSAGSIAPKYLDHSVRQSARRGSVYRRLSGR
jgi:hypothetical protein